MSVSIRPLHPVFAGEVAGVDCRSALSSAEVTFRPRCPCTS